jgi:short subunit dehydrogenase-like uncharacterized protein
MSTPPFDIIVFGATGFVGQIVTQYLADEYGVDRALNWAIAGRCEAKLNTLKAKYGLSDLALCVADTSDEKSLVHLCQQAKVVISTAGPYALHGEPLVKACVTAGTDYCDLTGEIQWYRKMLDKYEEQAHSSGARIVHCCGFDSIPSDLGVYYIQSYAQSRYGKPCTQVKLRVQELKGGASGGTVASMLNIVKEASKDAALRRALYNPYLLCPKEHDYPQHPRELKAAEWDEDFNRWIAPFVMAVVNTRVVHRSNALLGYPYSDAFQYDEAMMMANDAKGKRHAHYMSWGLNAFLAGAALPPTRWLLRKCLPKPGKGPSQEVQLRGYFDLELLGKTAQGEKILARVSGDRDPGYGATAKMLSQAGICLAKDIQKSDSPGGFWTPSTLFGNSLITRLQQHAGMKFELIE